MSTLTAFFTAIFQCIALAWATIHPDVNPGQHQIRQIAQQVKASYQSSRTGRKVFADTRAVDTGYWHTSGNLILDERGSAVRIQGINWYGFETSRKVPGGLAVQDYRAILDTIKSEGFNTVRIPLSNDMVEHPIVPEAISFTNARGEAINKGLRGLDSLTILDRIVEYSANIGLKVILDNHRSEAGDSAQGSGLWYTADYPESSWVADWQMLARRYAGNSTVIGMDLRNEPHNAASGGACWSGCGASRDWHLAAQRGGNAVLSVNPRLIVFVEGTDAVNNDWYWWGGNLQGVRSAPVHLSVPNQLVYSAHEYGPKEYAQKWFNGASTASLQAVFERHWGFVSRQGIAPVWIGEFGTSNRSQDITSNDSGSEGQWFQALTAFFGSNREINWTSWALNGEDSDGLLSSDYSAPANTLKMAALNRIMTGPAAAALPMQNVASVTVPSAPPQLDGSRKSAYTQHAPVPQMNTAMAYRPHLPASVLRGNISEGEESSSTPAASLHANASNGADGN
jgi:endoglucanase